MQKSTPPAVIGRAAEQDAVADFLHRASIAPAALLLSGPAGIGKTTIWRAALSTAEHLGLRALSVRGAEAEATLPFAGLIGLFDPVVDSLLPALPPVQSSALAVAMRRAAPTLPEPDPLTLSLATLSAVRLITRDSPLLLALDDFHWLDASSRRVLEFVGRRLQTERVGWLVSVRAEHRDAAAPLLGAVSEESIHVLDLRGLPVTALEQLLRERLGARFGRPTLLRIERASAGNPFFALELGRALIRRGITFAPEALPVPADMASLLRDRLAGLSPIAGRAVLIAAALARPTGPAVVAALGGSEDATEALNEAIRAGVLDRDGDAIAFSHPLLASVAYDEAGAESRRSVHRLIAEHVADPEERARHRALSAERRNEQVAQGLEEAAQAARNRGSPETAAELAELAWLRTPLRKPENARRRALAAARYLIHAGDAGHARWILEQLANATDSGPALAEVLIALADTYMGVDWEVNTRLLTQAVEQAGNSLARVAAERRLAAGAYQTLSDVAAGREHARLAVDLAERAGSATELAASLIQLAWLDWVSEGIVRDDLIGRAAQLQAQVPAALSVSLNARGLIRLWSGNVAGARDELMATRAHAERVGDWHALAHSLLELITVETVSGNWPLALELAHEAEAVAHLIGHRLLEAAVLVRTANVLAHLGRTDDARRAGEGGLAIAGQVGAAQEEGYACQVLGFLELSLGNVRAALDWLGPAHERYHAAGSRIGPSADYMEALIMAGRLEEAVAQLRPFEERARRLRRPWWLATSGRCRGLLLAASGDNGAARRSLSEALGMHDAVDNPFERARTVLVLGEVERRDRRRGAARRHIGAALAEFERLGAKLWAQRARSSLAHIGERRSGQGISEADRRIVELVASGQTNRQVAAALFMSPHTVDTHLRRIYRTLGVRSRTQLIHRLSEPAAGPGSEAGNKR